MTRGLTDLDAAAEREALDPDGMLEHIQKLPQECQAAWQNLARTELPEKYHSPRAVIIAGMGGSAIGGDLLRTWADPVANAPIIVSRDYTLPNFVGPQDLVIASSYSGGTEETLAAFKDGDAGQERIRHRAGVGVLLGHDSPL